MSEIEALFQWLLENAGRLPTTVVAQWRDPDETTLDIRFYNLLGGYTTISRQQLPDGQFVHALNAEATAAQILPFLQDSAKFYTVNHIGVGDRLNFWKQTVDLCRAEPVYLDQLLSRIDTCDEMCKNAQQTDLFTFFNDLRQLLRMTLDTFLGRDSSRGKVAA